MPDARVLVVSPWLPQYRVGFFELAGRRLLDSGVELTVAHGAPPPEVAGRNDAVRVPWARPLRTRYLGRGGRSLAVRSLPRLGSFDLVVLEQAIRNVETYLALCRHRLGGPPVALWGHGRTYTKPVSGVEDAWKRWLTRRAAWFFAYTQGGARHVVDAGVPESRVTVVQNATDTSALRRARSMLSERDVEAARQRLASGSHNACLYLGGLDASKRIDFLLEAAAAVAARVPDFVLLVAGDGVQRGLVEDRLHEPWLRYLGPVFGAERALLGAVSRLLLLPGRVGLAVVDAFALETPIVTTRWPYHAPEFEYVDDGGNGIVTDDRVGDFADAVGGLLLAPDVTSRLAAGCRASASVYCMEAMVDRFCAGVHGALAQGAGSVR